MSGRPGGWPENGVHRVPGLAAPVAAELERRGWTVAVVPRGRSEPELWDGLSSGLELPSWFGRNLDALEEALVDLARPTALVLAGWTAYAQARPEHWRRLLQVLQERADQDDPPLLVVLVD